MSSFRLILASLIYHWRMNLAVACGVSAGTAVLTGALLVGDSMRGSLRHLTLDRLGRIDEVLLVERFFHAELAEQLADEPEFQKHFRQAVPAIFLRASLENPDLDPPPRANRVNLIGCDQRFWNLGTHGPQQHPQSGQIVLNRALADQLGIEKPGRQVLVRLPKITSIPADGPLGRKSETIRRARLTVSQIIPTEGLGRFGLRPNQQLPRNAYVPLRWLQSRLAQSDRVNAILVAGGTAGADPSPNSQGVLGRLLKPDLDDYGIRLQRTKLGYFNVTSDRMILDSATAAAIVKSLKDQDVQPALTYLANTIASGDREIPYSTITAVDFAAEPPLGPLLTPDGKPIQPPADGEIVLNTWAAEDLHATPGDIIRVTYFEPESTDGQVEERTAEFRLAAVAQLAGAADDPNFTPDVPGVTDQLSIADWDPPFPFDAKRIRDKDEQYWENHRAAPKAFVSLAAGRKLWASRFGRTTSLRIKPDKKTTLKSLKEKLALDPANQGFLFQPVKQRGLAASKGTTPFDGLFLAFSFFVIAAAVMLVALLFRLGIDHRAAQVGILLAVGLGRRRATRLLAGEGLAVAALASLVGVVAGVGYAALMLAGLRTWWLAAVVTPFLRLYATPASLAVGYASGVIVAFTAIVWSVWRASRVATRQLLAGQTASESPSLGTSPRLAGHLAWIMLLGALALGLFGSRIGEQMQQAGAFFGAGSMVLVGSLALVWARLRSGATGPAVAAGRGNLLRLSVRNAARNPARSTLTIGLVAATCFLIIALSAFRLDPTGQTPTLTSGDGGFALVAESDQPIYHDLNSSEGRFDLAFSNEDSELLDRTSTTYALRVRPGDDASCLNLYQPGEPRILGVPEAMIHRGGFDFAGTVDTTAVKKANPWLLLNDELKPAEDGVPRVPVVVDINTATYSLHKGLGNCVDVADRHGRTIRLQIVGLLKNCIFQGDLLISEKALLRHFPALSGYRLFLIEIQPDQAAAVASALERTLGDYGLETETTGRRLAGFLAVQNTYLSTFQSLAGLGLLLGTFGLAAVQLRNVLERRRELALMRATGFRRQMLAWMVMLENGLLLLTGLACGVLAALVAVLPHLLSGGASIPWTSLAGTFLVVLLVGLFAGLAAVRAILTAPLLAALREER